MAHIWRLWYVQSVFDLLAWCPYHLARGVVVHASENAWRPRIVCVLQLDTAFLRKLPNNYPYRLQQNTMLDTIHLGALETVGGEAYGQGYRGLQFVVRSCWWCARAEVHDEVLRFG